MSLILASSNDIVVGKSPPWPLYDQEHNILLCLGDIVRDNEHRDALLAGGACYELSLEAPSKLFCGDNFLVAQEASTKPSEDNNTDKTYTFDDLKMKAGDRLNLELPADYDFRFSAQRQLSNERHMVKVIGFLKGASLLVTAPKAVNVQIMGGKKVIMRSFSGQNAFGFICNIEQVCKLPYPYLHLSIPNDIQGAVIRRAHRIKTRIIATVQDSKSDTAEQISALISNISANGVSLDAKQPLGEKGDILNLGFRVLLHNIEAYLSVKGVVRAILSANAAGTSDDESKLDLIRHGIEFQDLRPNDSVVLQSMIYQQMIENPHKLA